MKAEKINREQVRFTLNEKDLKDRNLEVSELAYGSDKTKALFDDMLKTAYDKFGIDFSEKALMIEAIPMSGETLTITVTMVEGAAQMGGLFGSNIGTKEPEDEIPQELLDQLPEEVAEALEKAIESRGGAPAQPKKAKKAKEEGTLVFGFETYEDLARVAVLLPESSRFKNEVYYHPARGGYYCIIRAGEHDKKYRHVLTALTEFSSEWYAGAHAALAIREHMKPVFKARGLQKIGALERLS